MWWLSCLFIAATLLNVECSINVTDEPLMLRTIKLEPKVLSCQPNITYVNGLEACVCTKNGHWPNNNCSVLFEKYYNDTVFKEKCKKDSYVRVHCNICKCNDKGEINHNRCTSHTCESSNLLESRKSIESIRGRCSPRTWYSFAPCQLCYCVNDNKLVCNPANKHLEKLILGKYSFSVCGDMFLKDTIDLMPFNGNGKMLRLGAKNIEPNNTLQIKYAPVPVPPEYNIPNEKPINGQRTYVDRSSESNSFESEDDDMDFNNINTGTRMPELDRIASKEHINIHKQTSDENNSERDIPVKKKKKTISTKFEIKAEEVPLKHGLRNDENNSAETYYTEFNLSKIFKKFLGLPKAPTRRSVSLDSRSACKPGTEVTKDCNMCYCMRNGNLLCTKKIC